MQGVIALPRTSLTFGRSDVASACVLLLFLCAWHWRVTDVLTIQAVGALVLFVGLCLAYGSVFIKLIKPWFDGASGLTFQFLTGYFVFNSLLFLVTLCSPFGIALNLLGLAVAAALALVALRRRTPHLPDPTDIDTWAPLVATTIACIGATIWCGDAQSPLQFQGDKTVFHVWNDTFIHVREISVFAQAHGLSTVQDIKLAGGQAPAYHFASYLSPAMISALSGASAMQVYASFQLPLGILLTGLAAYCLASKLFGQWPAVAAVVAIVLFPDAFQQGFQHRYLSYNFLSQVNLGMLYGIACTALAWMFMLDGCRRSKIALVLLGYGFLGLCLFYKAHLFVANSYMLMMFPIIFFSGVRGSRRLVLGIGATLVFCLVVWYSQTNPRVPVMRLDGSGIARYLVDLLHDYEPGWIRTTFRRIFLQEQYSKPVQLLFAAAMVSMSTFGIWLVATTVVLVRTRTTLAAATWWFPVIVFINYLVMALGLARDTRGVGTPDELINRPLVWAYFAIAAWTAAAGYRLLIGPGLPKSLPARAALLAAAFGCALFAVHSAPNLQTFPGRIGQGKFADFVAFPDCLVQSASFLRGVSKPDDVIQDSVGDPQFVLTALSERQLYVGAVAFGGENAEQEERLDAIAQFQKLTDAKQLREFAAARGIDWFLQHPDEALAWPDTITRQPAFACGNFRLFHFAQVGQVPAPSANRLPPGGGRALH